MPLSSHCLILLLYCVCVFVGACLFMDELLFICRSKIMVSFLTPWDWVLLTVGHLFRDLTSFQRIPITQTPGKFNVNFRKYCLCIHWIFPFKNHSASPNWSFYCITSTKSCSDHISLLGRSWSLKSELCILQLFVMVNDIMDVPLLPHTRM